MQHRQTSVLLAPVLILLLFSPALVGWDRLGFRDVSHFYTPLYDYVAARTSQQWLPTWNPLDQTGMPLIGETTTAVLYPVRYLLFSLPLSTDVAIAWYVVLHLIFASATARIAARVSGTSPFAATVAGILYPLSGSVLFLYTNLPFLVGAAWLPLVLGSLLSRGPWRRRTRVVIAGVSMAMMILGGDPQTALHAMMVVSAVWLVRTIRGRVGEGELDLRVLVAVPLLAALLAAPQIAASLSWSRQSDRVSGNTAESWTDPPQVGGKRYESFQYSLAPWHTLELATPNAFGSFLPVNRRLSQLIPGDGRTWTPTLYMGMLALLAIGFRLRHCRRRPIDVWLAMTLISLGLAMGHFGLVWWIQSTTGSMSNVDSAIGGPYWWLYQFCPGYSSFRYPAKWLPIFSLGIAIVTANSIDRGFLGQGLRPIAAFLAVFLSVVLVVLLAIRMSLSSFLDPEAMLPGDSFWGPLDVVAGLSQISVSLVHSILVLLALLWAIRFATEHAWSERKLQRWLLAIIAIDLAAAGYGLIHRVPRATERELMAASGEPIQPTDVRWMRTQSGGGWPTVWKETQDIDRLVDVESSGRVAWFGRWHLADRAAVLNNMVSIRSEEMARFFQSTEQLLGDIPLSEQNQFWESVRDWLAIEGVVHASGNSVAVTVDGREAQLVDRTFRSRIGRPELRAYSNWTVRRSADLTVEEFTVRLHQITQPNPVLTSRPTPIIQSDQVSKLQPQTGEIEFDSRVIARGAERAEYQFHLSIPALVSSEKKVSDPFCAKHPKGRFPAKGVRHLFSAHCLVTRPIFQDGHWVAEYSAVDEPEWQTTPVYRVDRLTQGVLLPAGDWDLRFRYAPRWMSWTCWLAVLGWGSVLGFTLFPAFGREPSGSLRRKQTDRTARAVTLEYRS